MYCVKQNLFRCMESISFIVFKIIDKSIVCQTKNSSMVPIFNKSAIKTTPSTDSLTTF